MSIILKDKKLVELLQKQVAHELGNQILYNNLASLTKLEGFQHSHKWFEMQAKEEFNHANMILEFLQAAGIDCITDDEEIGKQSVSSSGFSLRKAFELTVEREQKTTESINEICSYSLECKDFVTFKFVSELLYIQLDEEDEANDRLLATYKSNDDLIIDTYIGDMMK